MKVDVLLIAVENYAKLFAVFVFWRLLRGCKENIHGFRFLRFSSRYGLMFQASKSFLNSFLL